MTPRATRAAVSRRVIGALAMGTPLLLAAAVAPMEIPRPTLDTARDRPQELAERGQSEAMIAFREATPRQDRQEPDVPTSDDPQVIRPARRRPPVTDSPIRVDSVEVVGDGPAVMVSFDGMPGMDAIDYYLPVTSLERAQLMELRFFSDHRFGLYAIESSRGMAHIYYHYLIRASDQFYYIGEYLDLSYDEGQNTFVAFMRDSAVCSYTFNYELRNLRFHLLESLSSEGCTRG